MRRAVSRGMLTPKHAMFMLVGLVRAEVYECIDIERLAKLEERLAIELGRIAEVEDDEMLAVAQQLVTDALQDVAEKRGLGDCEAMTRYENALSRQGEAELAARRSS